MNRDETFLPYCPFDAMEGNENSVLVGYGCSQLFYLGTIAGNSIASVLCLTHGETLLLGVPRS